MGFESNFYIVNPYGMQTIICVNTKLIVRSQKSNPIYLLKVLCFVKNKKKFKFKQKKGHHSVCEATNINLSRLRNSFLQNKNFLPFFAVVENKIFVLFLVNKFADLKFMTDVSERCFIGFSFCSYHTPQKGFFFFKISGF